MPGIEKNYGKNVLKIFALEKTFFFTDAPPCATLFPLGEGAVLSDDPGQVIGTVLSSL
jgi:hypothetical protein